ncbi:MAG: CotH kinase family protein [Coriobacteriales bacterium]|nr:CotH kinase family protein [Coriobacteriales bacterium]
MSTSKRIGIVCAACMVVACIICTAMYALGATTEQVSGHDMGYEQTLFSTDKVHSIDIAMDNWDEFIQNCENEEYATCTVVVDGESYKNVAIRAKGNTSLRNVSQLDSERYSFKVEFDQYESARTYHGLDKLSLNNLIQDNTYMKDYLTYRMMGAFGVDAPLASYANITVNGEDWGLYLAVEGVEDSFLERVYGNDTGDLYKPDSMSFGGGRGNGREFNMDDFLDEQNQAQESDTDTEATGNTKAGSNSKANSDSKADASAQSDTTQDGRPSFPGANSNGSTSGGVGGGPGGGMGSSYVKLQYIDDDPDSYENIFNNAKTDVTKADKSRLIESLRKLSAGEDLQDVLDMDEVLRYFVVHDYVCNGDSYTGSMVHNYYLHENDGKLSMIPWDYNLAFGGFNGGDATATVNAPIDDPTSSGMGFGGFGGFAKQDETAGETDDNSDDDASGEESQGQDGGNMPQMPQGMQMPGNGDMPQMPSDGEMPQPPSGGNAPSFSGEQSNSPDNDANNNPMSFDGFGSSDSRPMVDWIFSDEQYTQAYHELYQQFLNEVDVQAIIDQTEALIAPFVERDPSKFCTYEEFQTGVDTLRAFCDLRSQSVQGQLDGTIPSTEEGQQEDSSALVDASSIELSSMGSMGNNGGGPQQGGSPKQDDSSGQGGDQQQGDDSQKDDGQQPDGNFARPDGDFQPPTGGPTLPDGMTFGGQDAQPTANTASGWIAIGASVIALAAGMGATLLFRRP